MSDVALAATGDENFGPDSLSFFKQANACSEFCCGVRRDNSSSASADNNNVVNQDPKMPLAFSE